jgi:hypothetical protein
LLHRCFIPTFAAATTIQIALNRMTKLKTMLGALAIALSAADVAVAGDTPPPSYASYFDKLPCVGRIGRCFDATIGGRAVTVIGDKARHERLTQEARQANDRVRDIYWEVPVPVDGANALDVVVRPNAFGLPHVGEVKTDPEVKIYPLDDQELDSKPELVAQDSVRINGNAAITKQDTLTQNTLPKGRYVIAITYRGTLNWDRKQVLIHVQ